MKPKLFLCVPVVLYSNFAIVGVPNTAPDLTVVVISSQTEVRIQHPFNISLRVENHTAATQTIRVMNCSWEDEWRSSNTNIPLPGVECTKNFPVDVQISPGDAYTKNIQTCIFNWIPDKVISFRMGFTSIGSTNTLWSNKAKLRVLPPDTWQHGTKIYRDCNHDGKIDWEVSGNTWMGHPVLPIIFKYFTNSDGSVYANGEQWTGQAVDTYKVDTNYDGYYDLEYGAGGTNGRIQWAKYIHESVPTVGKDFAPVPKEAWASPWTKWPTQGLVIPKIPATMKTASP